ncbi:hydrolase (had superfamily), yqek [hydrocarbon metagenome]|uniref:bis(5'-nucleosyl)-tetraphosphatase (symmetrical) n=1 Tax=hydrocarbon metagenome TaxID=938273 RepID=A0A0W8E6K0_9ZZZZ
MEASRALELIKAKLSNKRYQHSLQVADTAVKMARRYGLDESRANLAGILHDYARDLSEGELLNIAVSNNLIGNQVERDIPDLLHGPVGAFLLKQELGTKDTEILSAISHHTLGSVGMSDLEKVIFISDMIEPGRSYNGVEELRELAYKDLDAAMLTGLESSIRHCLDTGKILHPHTVVVRNCFLYKVNAGE